MQERSQPNRGELTEGELGRIWGATRAEGDGFGIRISESQALWLQMQRSTVRPPLLPLQLKLCLLVGTAVLTGSRTTWIHCPTRASRETVVPGSVLCGQCGIRSQSSRMEATPQEAPPARLAHPHCISSFPSAFTRSMTGLCNLLLMYAFSTTFHQTSLSGS